MADLRAPDPTLDALREPVGIIHQPPLPAIAHRLPGGAGQKLSACLERMPDVTASSYARWFAVPCRHCFPDAPPPGHDLGCHPECASAPRPDPNLAWQSPGQEPADV